MLPGVIPTRQRGSGDSGDFQTCFMAGTKRSSSTVGHAGGGGSGRSKQAKQTHERPREDDEDRRPAIEELTSALSLATAAISASLRFISGGDLLLLPSQTLTIDSSVHSAAVSLARLLSLLHRSPASLNLRIPHQPSSEPAWFLRFLSSSSAFGDPRWHENFRMSKPSFYLLLQTLAPSLNFRSGIFNVPSDHKLGAGLFHLAHAAPFGAVARRFGFPSPEIACRAFYEVCKAIADQLGHLFELSSDLTRVLQGFHWMSLPNCCGALGFSRFGSGGSAVIAQALIDSEGRFLDISAGWWASMPPAEILPRTKLHSSQAVVLCGGPPLQLNGVGSSVPRYFLGGPCCPLLPWLLTPFDQAEAGPAFVFNSVHARGMLLVHKAFARLRARWRLLKSEWSEECAEALPFVIVAACLLHNYLIKCSEPVVEGDMGVEEEEFAKFEGKGDEFGKRIRAVIASHLSNVINS